MNHLKRITSVEEYENAGKRFAKLAKGKISDEDQQYLEVLHVLCLDWERRNEERVVLGDLKPYKGKFISKERLAEIMVKPEAVTLSEIVILADYYKLDPRAFLTADFKYSELP